MKKLLGRSVILIPTQGGYQTEKRGTVIDETPKRFAVRVSGRLGTITFSKASCMGASEYDRTFPNYQVTAIMLKSSELP